MENGATSAAIGNRGYVAQYVNISIKNLWCCEAFCLKCSVGINELTARKPNI